LLFGLFLVAVAAVVVSVVVAATDVTGKAAGAIVEEWEDLNITRAADTTMMTTDTADIGPSVYSGRVHTRWVD
jgi:hypothetical protein